MVDDELGYFFKLGLSLLTQRRRQDLPVLCKRPLDRMELQSLGPHFFTWFNRTSSSSAFHGPFLIPSSLLPSIQNSFSFLRHKGSYFCHFFCKSFSISCAALSVIFLSFVQWRLRQLLMPSSTNQPTFALFSLFQNHTDEVTKMALSYFLF